MKRKKSNQSRYKATKTTASTPPLEATEQNRDILICDLWNNGTDSVHDMRVMNRYAKSHLAKTPKKNLQEAEQENEKMYLEACLRQQRKFSSLVASIDGLMCVEVTATPKRIASCLIKSSGNPTIGCVDTSRVRSSSLWCGTHTGASGVQYAGAQD